MGQAVLTVPTQQIFAAPDTYQKIVGVFTDLGTNHKFILEANGGKLTYQGKSNTPVLFNGVSDLSVNKACTVTYALFLNGALVPRAETPHTFTAAAKTEGISITGLPPLNNGDELEIYVKCDDATVVLDVVNLQTTYMTETNQS